jgi:2,4-dienoyl-CoA reductase-like NADH-dependent reductase (Old Yellow Enzyme family)
MASKTVRKVEMRRDHYRLFSEGRIGSLVLPNRLVRSATWDPSILGPRRMTEEVLAVYRRVAEGGAGLIITGDFSVVPAGFLDGDEPGDTAGVYERVRIEGYGRLVEEIRCAAPRVRIVAQISADYPGVGPTDVPSPWTRERTRPLTTEQVRAIAGCLVEAIAGLQAEGFDGVQLHAAHGGMLSCFLSPYSNRRRDEYGGSARNRARIIAESVTGARQRVGDFPILIKMNGTDYVEGGIDLDNLPELAGEIERAGVDAVEVSGGMWDCLVRSEEELGFRPVPAPESHTRIRSLEKQSYFLPYAERLALGIPAILVGGNRDVERMEAIVQEGRVDFVSLCRPLICEPDLPNRWREGRGGSGAACISCNSCLYDMYTSLDRGEPGAVTCLLKEDRGRIGEAQRWLSTFVEDNVVA